MPSNIEKFDNLTARVFASLYEAFPVEKSLQPADFDIGAEAAFNDADAINAPLLKDVEFFASTVRWLASAGYLEFRTESNLGTFYDATLTSKGLEVLKAVPDSLKDSSGRSEKTLGEYLTDSVKAGAVEAMRKGASYALSSGAALAWNAVLTAVR
ncbi:hypothetical protein BGLT_06765 [Caballeronia glathei]|uniref:Uncharacterized protein n=2 Tax=Caballeronia glathei TaxID=60547 RepID=A0A069PMM1_9BURK|nr:hypothetical protein BG61_20705 [Caballeronia glathei]CDY77959.1 hypothetical protein BGLT_06765 [Caballeronia glathei]